MSPFLCALHVGQPKLLHDERGAWTSSIARQRVSGPVSLLASGLDGDGNAQPYHGSSGAAVCAHLHDHYRFWLQQYGIALNPGAVGENFTLDALAENDVCVGDVIRVGSSVVQVSGPRVPYGKPEVG